MGISSLDLVSDRLLKFKIRIDELRSKEYYSSDPIKLITLLEHVIDQISETVTHISKEDLLVIKRVNILLDFYHMCLDEIEHIGVNNVPVELLPLFEKIKKIFKLNIIFVFRPSPLYTYSYYPLTKVITEISKKYQTPIIVPKDKLAIISFPSSEKNSALLHCCLVHEIAHHLNNEFSLAKNIELKILELIDKKLLKEYVVKHREQLANTKKTVGQTEITLDAFFVEEQYKSMLTVQFGDIIRKWLDELISDIISIHLFGPAYLFAFSEFIISRSDPKKYSDKHPPPFIRIKCMLELMDELGFSSDFSLYNEIFKRIDYYRKVSDQTFVSEHKTKLNLKNMILEKAIIGLFEPAKEQVTSIIKNHNKPYELEDLKHAIDSFKRLIPANEILIPAEKRSRPIDPITILNAAWIVRLNYIEELYSILQSTEKPVVRDILDRLVLKSLDLQEFHVRMVPNK